MSKLNQYDEWLTGSKGPAALVLREHLAPVEGEGGVVFPPTFAGGSGFAGGYNIDEHPDPDNPDKKNNVCIIDTVGSQANRIEPIFAEPEYAELIPQVVVSAGKEGDDYSRNVNILEAGHRAGDALVRCSELKDELHEAFKSLLKGDAKPLAKVAPTSLVFGVWDSRDTQAKLPRLVSSSIRALNVRRLTRGAVYIPPVDYAQLDVFSDKEKQKAEGDNKSPLAKRGFVHVPASASHGGVIAEGGIRRDATLSLAALQQVRAGDDADETLKLRRYVFSLALVALTANTSAYLRQGCNLVREGDTTPELTAVYRDGKRESIDLSHEDAIEYAKAAAAEFEVGDDRTVNFDKKLAKADVKKKE